MATTNPMMHFLLHSEGKLAIRPKFLDLLMNYDWRLGINSTLTQIPQPMHSSSEMSADLDFGPTSMQCFPAQETNHTIREDAIPCQKIRECHKPYTMETRAEPQKPEEIKRRSLPIFTTGQFRLHSCPHFLGLHLSSSTTATRLNLCAISGEGQQTRDGEDGMDSAEQSRSSESEPLRPRRAILGQSQPETTQ